MDAVALLKQDHREVEELFRRYENSDATDTSTRRDIVQSIIQELSIHASIEEQILYPAVRRALPDGEQLAEEATDEHQEVKETLAELDKMNPGDAGFDQRVRSLISDVRHHVEEEENEMLPRLRNELGADRLEEMGSAMESAKGMAPTRPHPNAPNTAPGNIVAGAVAGVVDRARDAVTGRSRKSPSRKKAARKAAGRKAARTRRKTAARKSTARKSTARKSAARVAKSTARRAKSTARRAKSTARKATGRKSTARKSTARKSTARRKTTGRKTAARKSTARRKTTGRKAASRKTTARKSTSRKSTSRKATGRKPASRKTAARAAKTLARRKSTGRKSTSRKSTARRSR